MGAGGERRRLRGDAMLVFGGVYGNWPALRAACAVAKEEGIPAANIVITGDLAGYCADGARVVAHCQTALADAVIVRGNCERALAEDADDCQCGFAVGGVCHSLSAAWHGRARATIAPAQKRWMGGLPPRVDVVFGGRELAVVHADGDSDNAFVFPSTPGKDRLLDKLGVDGAIAGHSGIPFSERVGDRLWHNSGALGMPANDGTARAWLSIWRRRGDDVHIRHCPLSYDFAAAARAMRRAGLPPHYRETLASGAWPSDDILPPAEKRRQGRPLRPPARLWRRALAP